MAKEELSDPKDYRKGLREAFATYAWVWRELLGDTGRRAGKRLVLCLCIGNLVSMSVPWMLGQMINSLERNSSTQIIGFFLGIAAVLLTRRGIQYFESHAREIMFGENQGTVDLRTSALFLGISVGQHLRENDTLSASSLDKGRMRAHETMGMLLTEGGETVFLLSSSYVALWFINPIAGAVSTGLLVMCVLWSLRLNQRIAEITVPLEKEFQDINRTRFERLKQVERVKTFGKEKEEIQELTRRWNELIGKDRSFWLWVADQNTWRNVISSLVFVIVMGGSVRAAWSNHTGFGMLFPLFIWMNNIIDNIWRLGNLEHRVNWNLPSIQSMREALSIVPDIIDRPDAKMVDGTNGLHIEFVNVSQRYRLGKEREAQGERGRLVLQNVNLDMPPGTILAITGLSGAGKSTLVRLLRRDIDPDEGSVRVNGDDLRDVQLSSWLRHTSNIPQRAVVFGGTVRFNLLWGLPLEARAHVGDEELWALVQALQLHERLTHGLDTVVGEGGIELSGGEAQRLMVGAAIVRNAPCLLIDEATSSLDSSTERAIQKLLMNVLAHGRSAIIITHHLSTVRPIANKYLVLRPLSEVPEGESQIEAIGDTFEETCTKSPTLRRLAQLQGMTANA